jgi:Uma2 family endonuclease
MTVDEFWEFVNRPENADRLFELRHGQVIELSRPKTPHGIVTSNVTTDLTNYARRVRKGFVTSNDAGVVLAEHPGTVVGPDVAYFVGVRRFREVVPKWSDVPPILAVEVLSPNDKPSEVNEKVEDYLRNGVKVVWLVDYESERVTVYKPDRAHTVLKAAAELSGGDELPGFSCKVGDFFLLPEEEAEAPAA